MEEISKWNVIPTVKTVDQFYDNEDFLNAFVENINKFDLEKYEKVIFSYHGLPKANLMMFIQKAMMTETVNKVLLEIIIIVTKQHVLKLQNF